MDMGPVWSTIGVFSGGVLLVYLMNRFPVTKASPAETPPTVLLKVAWNRYGNKRLYVSGLVINDDGNVQKHDYGYYDLLANKVVGQENTKLTQFQRELIEDAFRIHQSQKGHGKTLPPPNLLKVVKSGQLISTQYKKRGQHRYYVDQYTESALVEVGSIDLHHDGNAQVVKLEHEDTVSTAGKFLRQEDQKRGDLQPSEQVNPSSTHTVLPGSQLQKHFQNSFEIGALGETYIGGILTALYPNQVFHGVKLTQQDGDIDHLLICAKGVFVINTKTHPQKLVVTLESGEMTVAGRDTTKYIQQADAQVAKVRLEFPMWDTVGIRPLIVFAHVDPTSTIHPPYTIRDSELTAMLSSLPLVLSDAQVTELAAQVTASLKED